MINFNTINQIEDIMTILNNTRKVVAKSQQKGSSFGKDIQQVTVQTPTQTVQQTTIMPSAISRSNMYDDLCCVKGCNKPAVLWINNKAYCKEHAPDNRISTEED